MEVSKPHPAYGLADETRLMILKDAMDLGVLEAARMHNVHNSSIYNWRRAYQPDTHNPKR